jgi:hypothetical protein
MIERYIPAISSTARREASIIVCGVKPAVPAFWSPRQKTPFSDFWSICQLARQAGYGIGHLWILGDDEMFALSAGILFNIDPISRRMIELHQQGHPRG